MAEIVSMGKFTAVGMRARVPTDSIAINTCALNDSFEAGTVVQWSWANPTNRRFPQPYHDVVAPSVEHLWQNTKVRVPDQRVDQRSIESDWRWNKGRRPIGAYAGPREPLITSAGQARRTIYVPAYRRQVVSWIQYEPLIALWIERLRAQASPVFLRDHDVGRGLDRDGPMSHAWVLAVWLNTGMWPE